MKEFVVTCNCCSIGVKDGIEKTLLLLLKLELKHLPSFTL